MTIAIPSIISYSTPVLEMPKTHFLLGTAIEDLKGRIATRLPKNIALIRSAAARVFTLLLVIALKGSLFRWPLMLLGTSFAMWTIYRHFWQQDPLLKAFENAVGGKQAFLALPQIQLTQTKKEKLYHAIAKICWERLPSGISRAKTLDGRQVILLKAENYSSQPAKSVIAFVERIGPKDLPGKPAGPSVLRQAMWHAIATPLKGNTFAAKLEVSKAVQGGEPYDYFMCSSLTKSMAGELGRLKSV